MSISRSDRVKCHEAKTTLRHALNHQQTISIKKLDTLLRSLNNNLEGNTRDREINYLKGEIKKLSKEYRRLKKNKSTRIELEREIIGKKRLKSCLKKIED